MFTANCAMNQKAFPFDNQRCAFDFIILEPTDLVNVSRVDFVVVDYGNPDRDEWTIVNPETKISNKYTDFNDQVSSVSFSIQLKRNPNYYVWNCLVPAVVLILLSLLTVFMMPDSDRVCFNVYLFLTFAVTLSQAVGSIAQSSLRVILVDIIQILTIICGFIVAHGIVMLCLSSQTKISKSLLSKIDIGGYVLAAVILIGTICCSVLL